MNMITLIIIMSAPLIVNLVISHMYKDVEKQNKGFVFIYYKLSYRRRFIRDLWMLPFAVILFLVLYWATALTFKEFLIIGFVFLSVALISTVYNYVKWQKYEKEA